MTILIAGDTMMQPERFRERIQAEFGAERFQIRIKKYAFDQTGFFADDQTQIPSGMCFEPPEQWTDREGCGVAEFYGDPNSLMDDLEGVDILVIHGAALPRAVLERAQDLRYIISLRGGPANIDLDCVKEKGIRFFNTNGKNAPAVAEFALGALLDFERGITYGNTQLRKNWWWIKGADQKVSHELRHKKFGFVGYGRIAQSLRALLQGFDIQAFTYSPHVDDAVLERDGVVRMSLEDLAATCDYVSLHTRPVKGQPPVFSAEMIGRMREDAVLINTGRGALLDYPALKRALQERRIRGAVLDVLGNEDFGFYRELIAMDNVLVTPHIAGQSVETCQRACDMCVDILHQILEDVKQ
ncbi:MAG: hypothetical protein IJ594_01520 [Oscillospiraceae bacterium]|nr:hypothetical protein [Oscillospiraceae bacterium]